MVLTQVYLKPTQKALTSQAKKSGRKVSEIMGDAVDAIAVFAGPYVKTTFSRFTGYFLL